MPEEMNIEALRPTHGPVCDGALPGCDIAALHLSRHAAGGDLVAGALMILALIGVITLPRL
jgi:hypothetical protein